MWSREEKALGDSRAWKLIQCVYKKDKELRQKKRTIEKDKYYYFILVLIMNIFYDFSL